MDGINEDTGDEDDATGSEVIPLWTPLSRDGRNRTFVARVHEYELWVYRVGLLMIATLWVSEGVFDHATAAATSLLRLIETIHQIASH